MREQEEKNKGKKISREEKEHFRGTDVIFEFGLSSVNAIFKTES